MWSSLFPPGMSNGGLGVNCDGNVDYDGGSGHDGDERVTVGQNMWDMLGVTSHMWGMVWGLVE